MTLVKIDMHHSQFQEDLFKLAKNDQITLLKTLRKINQLTWQQLYADNGLKWEAVVSKKSEKVYSFRFSQQYRALALRQGDFLRLLTLHVAHASAYK